MAPRLFITGVTGYIGGQFLETLIVKHPDYHITTLVRAPPQAEQLVARHPALKVVIGDLNSISLLTEQSEIADIVIQIANADHPTSISALIRGLSSPTRLKPGTLIQLSGAASTIDASCGYGQPSTRIWDDITDLHEITHFPETVIHAVTDQLVINEGLKSGIKTAILEPPMVYGRSEGVKMFSMGLPWMVKSFEERGNAFMVAEAKQFVTAVHVRDLAEAMMMLVEDAVTGGQRMNWGEKGIYYVEGGEFVFRDVVDRIVEEMVERGLIPTADIEEVSAEEVSRIHPWGPLMWGSNMRTRSSRLKGFGWRTKEVSIIDAASELFS